jgi:hypothetical protein
MFGAVFITNDLGAAAKTCFASSGTSYRPLDAHMFFIILLHFLYTKITPEIQDGSKFKHILHGFKGDNTTAPSISYDLLV